MIFDPVTGRHGVAESRPAAGKGYTDVRLQMEAGQSLLLKTFPTPSKPNHGVMLSVVVSRWR